MSKLTRKEQAIFEAMSADMDKEWTPEDIARAVYGRSKPESWRHGLLATMRTLILKTDHSRIRIVRTTPLGRGHAALFRATKVPENRFHGVDMNAPARA